MVGRVRLAKQFPFLLGLILVGCLGLYLVGNNRVQLWDRDEPRYAECSRQVLQSGDWVVLHFLDKWRNEKPPLIYWCQASSMMMFGDTGFAARLPSSLAAAATVLLVGLFVRRFVGARRALWTVFIFCTSGLIIAAAKMCITDAVLMFFVVSGQICLGILWASGRTRYQRPPPAPPPAQHGVLPDDAKKPDAKLDPRQPAVQRRSGGWVWLPAPGSDPPQPSAPAGWVAPMFWIVTALAGLTKGPQALGMHAVTIIVLFLVDVQGRWRSRKARTECLAWLKLTRPLIGVPILAAIVAPWLILVHQRAPGFVAGMLNIAGQHVATDLDGHAEPPGFHALLIFGTFFPWSLLLPTTIILAWRHRHMPPVRFAIATTLGPWLLMECVKVKLPFYVMPAFPGLSFLTADAIVRCIRNRRKEWWNVWFRSGVYIWGLATLALAAAPWAVFLAFRDTRVPHAVIETFRQQLPMAAMLAYSAFGLAYAGFVVWQFKRGKFSRAAISLGGGMAIMIAILFGGIFPNLGILRVSSRIASVLKQNGAYGPKAHVAEIGYREPSLAFYEGGGSREQESEYYLQAVPPDQWEPWITIDRDILNQLRPEVRQYLEPIGEEWGITYSVRGTWEDILIFKARKVKTPAEQVLSAQVK